MPIVANWNGVGLLLKHKDCLFLVKVEPYFSSSILVEWDTDDEQFEDEDDSDEEFYYPGISSFEAARPDSRTSSVSDYFTRPGLQRIGTDLTLQLSQAPDFRVPTHEAPQKVFTSRRTPTPQQVHAQWERDEAVQQCRDCQCRFSFINRRVSLGCSYR